MESLNSAFTALDVIRRLRPEFLMVRGPVTAETSAGVRPVVYVDRVLVGGLENLQVIPKGVILEIRYLRATAAAEWTGALHTGGVIAVSTRR